MKKIIWGFSGLLFVTFVAHAMISTQAVPFLTEVGYSSSERGYIMAAYALVAMIGQFYVGYLCDKYKTTKKFVIYSSIILMGFMILTFKLNDRNFLLHLFLMGNTVGFIRIVGNLMETWLVEVDGLYPYFGRIRSFGSLGWALSSLASGYIILNFGYENMMWISVGINLLVVIVSFYMEDAAKADSASVKLSDIKELFLNKNYVLLIVVYTLTWIVYNADNVSITDYIFSVGGTEADIGKKWFVQALSELPLMLVAGYLLNRLRGKKMMVIGSIALSVRFILYAAFPSVNAIILLSVLQMFSFPFILVSQKELFLRESPAHLRSSGQMISVSFSAGLSAIISPIIAGYLGEFFPIRNIVFGMGVFMIIPILIMMLYKPHRIT